MKIAKLTIFVVAIHLLVVSLAWSQGGNPPASTKESGDTSGHGMTAVEQTGKGVEQHGQQVGEIKRTVLMKQEILSVPDHEGLLVQVEFAPGAREPKHTHPGDVFAYVEEGTLTQNLEGTPAVTVKPGETFFVPAGKVHWGENVGKTPVKVLATFVVEKGKPLSSPALLTTSPAH
jgi:quercetin dioxygenase-like cupin family protein